MVRKVFTSVGLVYCRIPTEERQELRTLKAGNPEHFRLCHISKYITHPHI